MAKPEWGTKRTCQSCGSKFYDLGKEPVVCPSCGAVLDLKATKTSSSTSAAKAKPKPAMVAMVSDRGCRWPIGPPGESGFHFCGSQAAAGRPYCTSHCSVAYRNKDEAAA